MRILICLGACALLVACGKPDNAAGPGGVTVGEAKALDEAAEMIEAQRLPPAALVTAEPAATGTPLPGGTSGPVPARPASPVPSPTRP